MKHDSAEHEGRITKDITDTMPVTTTTSVPTTGIGMEKIEVITTTTAPLTTSTKENPTTAKKVGESFLKPLFRNYANIRVFVAPNEWF